MKIKSLSVALASAGLFTASFALSARGAPAASQKPAAVAYIMDAQGNRVGMGEFFAAPGGARLLVTVHGLTTGEKGIHIHEKGTCTAPDFKSAGGHLNPDGKHHGLLNPQGRHEGDMTNLNVDAKGSAKQEFNLAGVEVTGNGPRSLFHAGGTSLVIHAKMDDEKSDPAGNAGDRIACGVIRTP